jgi:hypothetical protein
MSKRSATGKDSSTLGDRKEPVATMEGKPRKGRRSGKSGEQGVVSNPFGLVLIERFELKPIIRTCSMNLLYRDENPYKIEHTGPSLSCIRNKEFPTQNVMVCVYELPVDKMVPHLDLIEGLNCADALSNPVVLDACLRRPDLLAKRQDHDADIVTNYAYFQNGKGPLAVCIERCEDSSNWRLFSQTMYERGDLRREAYGRCRFIVCSELGK